MGRSEKRAFDHVAARVFGLLEIDSAQPDEKRPEWSRVDVSRVEGSSSTTAGRASTLRRKANVNRTPLEAYWLTTMSKAWLLALNPKDKLRARAELLIIGAHLGEVEFVQQCLLPLFERKNVLPDFSPRD